MQGATIPLESNGGAEGASAPSDEALRILDVVAEILSEGGLDSLQLRDVAKRARVSLSTIYAHFPSKDELLIAAVERWMQQRVYDELPDPRLETPLAERLTDWYRHLLAPWEQSPTMLRVFMTAAMLPGGDRLAQQGIDAVRPTSQRMFDGCDQDFVIDVSLILTNVVYGLLGQFANGQVDMSEIVTGVERTIQRLTAPT